MNLDIGFDNILYQFSKGLTIEQHRRGVVYTELEKVKLWKNRNGYEFHIYGNEHLINSKPHFHFLKKSENFEAKFYFDGELIELKSGDSPPKQLRKYLNYFLEDIKVQDTLVEIWNSKNPDFLVSKNTF